VNGRDDDIQGRRAARPPRPADVRSLERRRLQTLVEANIAAALSLHASDYQLIPPNGQPVSRDEYLGMIGRGDSCTTYSNQRPTLRFERTARWSRFVIRLGSKFIGMAGKTAGYSGTRISTSCAMGAGRRSGLRQRGSRTQLASCSIVMPANPAGSRRRPAPASLAQTEALRPAALLSVPRRAHPVAELTASPAGQTRSTGSEPGLSTPAPDSHQLHDDSEASFLVVTPSTRRSSLPVHAGSARSEQPGGRWVRCSGQAAQSRVRRCR
jgi:hypothetical protein